MVSVPYGIATQLATVLPIEVSSVAHIVDLTRKSGKSCIYIYTKISIIKIYMDILLYDILHGYFIFILLSMYI